MGCYFTKDNDLDEALICKTVKVFDHIPHRKIKKRQISSVKWGNTFS